MNPILLVPIKNPTTHPYRRYYRHPDSHTLFMREFDVWYITDRKGEPEQHLYNVSVGYMPQGRLTITYNM